MMSFTVLLPNFHVAGQLSNRLGGIPKDRVRIEPLTWLESVSEIVIEATMTTFETESACSAIVHMLIG